MTDTFPEDEREETDVALPTEGMNKTIGMLPNINAVTAANMQPILRTVSAINKPLLGYDLRNLFMLTLADARASIARQSIRLYAS